MTLLFRILYASHCKGTHHKLAMDALRHLTHDPDDRWTDLFLAQSAQYLRGSKDPDKVFKDFRNHVLHVTDNYWGGAATTGRLWYERALQAFQSEEWQKGVYACGVLSHYITDPVMPLHTGQTDHEKTIHRACEWSVSKSYDLLNPNGLTERSRCTVTTDSPDWLEQLIVQGAELSHAEYNLICEQYDFDTGVQDPPEGLNEQLQVTFRRLLRQAAQSVGHAIDQLILNSGVTPPPQSLTVKTAVAGLSIPVYWVTSKMADHADRKAVRAIFQELQETGTVERHLPEDERTVSELYASEVLETTETNRASSPSGPRRPPTRATAQVPRYYLAMTDPVVDAPSIGSKTAKRLKKIGISTVTDLLEANISDTVDALGLRYITEDTFSDWQKQARVMASIPSLRCHDAQILVGCEIESPQQLAAQSPSQLLALAEKYVLSPESRRYLRDPQAPDLEEVQSWITSAQTVVDSAQAA